MIHMLETNLLITVQFDEARGLGGQVGVAEERGRRGVVLEDAQARDVHQLEGLRREVEQGGRRGGRGPRGGEEQQGGRAALGDAPPDARRRPGRRQVEARFPLG